MPLTVALDLDGPYNPEAVLEAAEALAEITRRLNHATRDPACLEYPAEAGRLIWSLQSAASRLPQLLGQVSHWYAASHADAGVMTLLGVAGITAEQLSRDLKEAASAAARIAAAKEGDGDAAL